MQVSEFDSGHVMSSSPDFLVFCVLRRVAVSPIHSWVGCRLSCVA
jgi:hypothetical protein